MTQKSDSAITAPAGNHPGMAATEIRRQQQREQTLEWLSLNALSTFQSAWRRAKLDGSGIDCAPGAGRSAQ
jgi:hypothetical protein